LNGFHILNLSEDNVASIFVQNFFQLTLLFILWLFPISF